jgi:hypothetical protein
VASLEEELIELVELWNAGADGRLRRFTANFDHEQALAVAGYPEEEVEAVY